MENERLAKRKRRQAFMRLALICYGVVQITGLVVATLGMLTQIGGFREAGTSGLLELIQGTGMIFGFGFMFTCVPTLLFALALTWIAWTLVKKEQELWLLYFASGALMLFIFMGVAIPFGLNRFINLDLSMLVPRSRDDITLVHWSLVAAMAGAGVLHRKISTNHFIRVQLEFPDALAEEERRWRESRSDDETR